jgi:hypothetical protein
MKAFLETQNLGVPIFQKHAPINKADGTPQRCPYIVINDRIATVPLRSGNGRRRRAVEQVQLDLYEEATDEVPSRTADLVQALDGARPTTAPQYVFMTALFSGPNRTEVLDSNPVIVRNNVTVNLYRKI